MKSPLKFEFVYSDRYVPGQPVPANPASNWMDVGSDAQENGLNVVLDATSRRDQEVLPDAYIQAQVASLRGE